jgi:microsomal dipeptidase-like Zn-dependent dipeptidase
LFVTISHHFFNNLCGHAESLAPIIRGMVDQSEGINTGFTSLGKKVLHRLLENTNGQRIFVDVKHMSVQSRLEYYELLDAKAFGDENIPIVVSHGAANGLISRKNPSMASPETATKLQSADINFYDEELMRIARSGGIFGLQLDERRIASEHTLKQTKHSVQRHKIMHYRSELLWNQVKHISELLDRHDLFAWDMISLGTDFDGIIDPLNSFWTAEQLPFLADFLERHVHNYVATKPYTHSFNNLDADEIVDRIFSANAHAFFKKWFK